MADGRPPHPSREPGRADGRDDTASWHRMAGMGVEFVAAVGIFTVLGWWLDRKFGTSPWLVIVGVSIGFVGGLWNMIKAARKVMGP